MIQELHYSLDRDDIYYRFFSSAKDFRHTRIKPLLVIDYTTNMILVCVHAEEGKQKIIASGGFFRTKDPSDVEMAFVVQKEWRGNGISKTLLNQLVIIARELNYSSFSAHVLKENIPMIHIFETCGYEIISKTYEDDIVKYKLDITK